MKTTVLTTALLAACGLAQAQEVGMVLSRTAVYQQVAVPRQNCAQTITPNAPTSGGGAFTGAIAGGVIGSVIGDGRGHQRWRRPDRRDRRRHPRHRHW